MNELRLIEGLMASVGKVPSQAGVIGLQQLSLDDMRGRTQRLLSLVGEHSTRSLERGDWTAHEDHTAIRLPDGARAMFYHASGAVKYSSGLAPFDAMFERVGEREELTRLVMEAARGLNLEQWAGERGEIVFERLWQTKAQGADRSGKLSDPVLTRIVGAYRHVVDGIPVLGAASVALKLTGNRTVDTMALQVRPGASETIDMASIIDPELAARQLVLQLTTLMGKAREALPDDAVETQSMRFGYLDLGKRKAQRLLAPVFLAQVNVRHALERQAYVLAVGATEKGYLPICQCGTEAAATVTRLNPTTRPA